MILSTRETVAGLLIAIALAVAGCGGGSSETSSTAASPGSAVAAKKNTRSKKKLRWEWHATMACKKGMEQADRVMHEAAGKPAPHPPSAAPDWESFKVPIKALLPTFRQTARELGEVQPEPADAYDYEQILERLRSELKQAEAEPNAPISSRPLSGAGKAAYVYGIHACLF